VAYRLRRRESIGKGIRRVVRKQLDGAIDGLDRLAADEGDPEEIVHDVRKRTKMVRGAMRLVRDPLGDDYSVANTLARDAAHCLAGSRDAQVAPRTLDRLLATMDPSERSRLEPLRRPLRHRGDSSKSISPDEIEHARALLTQLRDRTGGWHLGGAAIRPGLVQVYRRGRKRLREAVEHPTPTALHELRKRVKDLWYHVRLLEQASPTVLHPLRDALHDLEDALGDDHDLWTLVTIVRELPEARDRPDMLELLEARADVARAELRDAAFRLGERMYAERPSAFGRRVTGYVTAWRHDGPEVPVGPIEDLMELPTARWHRRPRSQALVRGIAAMAIATVAATLVHLRKGHRH
jgi:CHAD domain-containing protein